MMKVQARMLVPAWKRLRAAQALSSVSCTRSSARSRLPDSERPKARRCGMTCASCVLNSSVGERDVLRRGVLAVLHIVVGGWTGLGQQLRSRFRMREIVARRRRAARDRRRARLPAYSAPSADRQMMAKSDDHQRPGRDRQHVAGDMRRCSGAGIRLDVEM